MEPHNAVILKAMIDRREFIASCIAARLAGLLDAAYVLPASTDGDSDNDSFEESTTSSTSVASSTSMFAAAWHECERKYGPWGTGVAK